MWAKLVPCNSIIFRRISQLRPLNHWRIGISIIIIFQFLTTITFLNRSLDKALRAFPHLVIQESESFCKPFSSSYPDETAESNREIFFLETSGEECLTPRQVCSIESAARTNPHMPVTLYVNSNKFDNSAATRVNNRSRTLGNKRNCDTMAAIAAILPNVKVIRLPMEEQLRETPLWDSWYKKGQLGRSRYPHVHLSDTVRVAMLQKRGGLYLDLDCVVFRPLHCLANTAGYLPNLPTWIENGVLTFERSHPFLNFLMKVMIQNYKPEMRESMGPPSLGLAVKFYCGMGMNDAFQHASPYSCAHNRSIHLQSPDSFYAIRSEASQVFVRPEVDVAWASKLLSKSYLSHVYFHAKHKVPLDSLYSTLARQFCPTVYNQFLQFDF